MGPVFRCNFPFITTFFESEGLAAIMVSISSAIFHTVVRTHQDDNNYLSVLTIDFSFKSSE